MLCNTVLTRYYAGEKFLPESHPLSAFVKFLPQSILRPVSAWAEEKLFQSWVRPYNAYLKGRSDVRFESMKDLFEGEATILMDALEFAPVDRPAGARARGRPADARAVRARFRRGIRGSIRGKKSVFVYLGSYGEQFTRIVEYLGRMLAGSPDYQVIAATGGLYGYSGAACPPNVIVSDYVPASLVLSRNCAAMITHGGRGSIYSALQHGVPLVGIPNQGEQEWNLDAVERNGLGRKLSAKRISFETFREAMRAVIDDPSFRAQCRGVQGAASRLRRRRRRVADHRRDAVGTVQAIVEAREIRV